MNSKKVELKVSRHRDDGGIKLRWTAHMGLTVEGDITSKRKSFAGECNDEIRNIIRCVSAEIGEEFDQGEFMIEFSTVEKSFSMDYRDKDKWAWGECMKVTDSELIILQNSYNEFRLEKIQQALAAESQKGPESKMPVFVGDDDPDNHEDQLPHMQGRGLIGNHLID